MHIAEPGRPTGNRVIREYSKISTCLHRNSVVVQGKGSPLFPLLYGEPVVDLLDRRVERIRVLARSTDMGVPLLRVHPAFEALRHTVNPFGSRAEEGRGRQESA